MKKSLFSIFVLFFISHLHAQVPAIVSGEIKKTFGDGPFYLEVESNSPGAITYSVLSGAAATVTPDGLVTIRSAGSVIVHVVQAASPPFSEGVQNLNLVIGKASPRFQIVSENKVDLEKKLTLKAVSNPPGATFKWSVISQSGTNATLKDSVLSGGPTAGTLEIKAELVADDNFEPQSATLTNVTQTISVEDTAGIPAITFQDIQKRYGDGSFPLQASSNSPGDISYSIIQGNAASVTPEGFVTILKAGTVIIQLSQASSSHFQSTLDTAVLTISKAATVNYTITSANKAGIGQKIALTAVSYPPGATFKWSIVSQSGTQANISNSVLSAGPTTGSLNVKAEVVIDENFEPQAATATSATQTITILDTAGIPQIVFPDIKKTYGDYPFYLQATSNSTGTITYSVLQGNAAEVTPEGLVTIRKAGTVRLLLSQAEQLPFGAKKDTATLTVSKASVAFYTITSANKVGVDKQLTLKATSYPKGAAFKWSIVSQSGTAASLSDSILSAGTASGTLDIKAELITDDNFEPQAATATTAIQTIRVQSNSGIPVISIGNLTKKYTDSSFYLQAVSESPGIITYSVIDGTAASVTPEGRVSINGTGQVTIQVRQEASPPYDEVAYTTLLTITGIVTDVKSEAALFTDVTVYPVPAKDFLYIKRNQADHCAATITLSDAKGQVVFNSNQTNLKEDSGIDIGNMTPGIYNLRMVSCEKTLHRRVVIQ